MKINGKAIAENILTVLKKKITTFKKSKPKLVVFLVSATPENLAFVKIKQQTVKKIGGLFELIQSGGEPDFEDFANELRVIAHYPQTTGVVIQQPLPASLSTDSLYNYIPQEKEIEGHKNKALFTPPIALAVLTILKFIYQPSNEKDRQNVTVDLKKDGSFFRRVLKRKKIVLIGRGVTGGKPIAHTLTDAKINFINIHSQTPNADFFEKEADIIISAVGKKVIFPENIKPGVMLISVGMRKEGERWKADYDEKEIKNIASFYTPVPGGIGPLDIAYLMHNLVEAEQMQI